jgi:peptide/nickel transport system permease protein
VPGQLPDAGTAAHLLLPALNLALFKIALVIRLTRAGVREALPMDYVKFARAKGLSPAAWSACTC